MSGSVIVQDDGAVVAVVARVEQVAVAATPALVDLARAQESVEVTIEQPLVEVRPVGARGPQGPKGDPGDGATPRIAVTKLAAAALSGHRLVRCVSATQVNYADAGTADHADDVLGMTLGAAAMGATVDVLCEGEATEPSWSWAPLEAIYLGAAGALTQTPPSAPSAFSLPIGYALSATTLRVRLGTAVDL